MKSRGFTLVEILAVITIVAILILILVPSIDSIIKASRKDTYELQLDLMKNSLKDWASAHAFDLPTNENESITVTLGELKKEGFISIEVRNPQTDECFSNTTELLVTKVNNKYQYSVNEETISFYESESCEVIE